MKRGFQTRITAQVKIHRETGVGARQLQTHFKAIDYAKRGDGQYDDATFWQKFCRISTLQKFGVFPLGREKNLIYTSWELKLKPLNSGNLPPCKEKCSIFPTEIHGGIKYEIHISHLLPQRYWGPDKRQLEERWRNNISRNHKNCRLHQQRRRHKEVRSTHILDPKN